jgi:hypothetical protein
MLGRKMYVYQVNGPAYNLIGEFEIRPMLKEGWMKFGGKNVKISKSETRDEYKEAFDPVISLLIREKKLFININEPLINYE